jgi:hypothetical protein
MTLKKLLTKYLVLLLSYTVITRFIEPYAMRLYYTIYNNPQMGSQTIQTIQSISTAFTFLINLVIVILLIIDSKGKKLIDWLIIVISFFSPETGITIFIVWQTYKEFIKKYEA